MLALNAQKYLALHYLRQQEIRTSEMHSTRGNIMFIYSALLQKDVKQLTKIHKAGKAREGTMATEGTEFL